MILFALCLILLTLTAQKLYSTKFTKEPFLLNITVVYIALKKISPIGFHPAEQHFLLKCNSILIKKMTVKSEQASFFKKPVEKNYIFKLFNFFLLPPVSFFNSPNHHTSLFIDIIIAAHHLRPIHRSYFYQTLLVP